MEYKINLKGITNLGEEVESSSVIESNDYINLDQVIVADKGFADQKDFIEKCCPLVAIEVNDQHIVFEQLFDKKIIEVKKQESIIYNFKDRTYTITYT